MKLLCPYCSEAYKIEFDERKTPFEERKFYLVPKDKSIHGDDRYSVLKESICIPTTNFEDPKEELSLYKEICTRKNRNFNKI